MPDPSFTAAGTRLQDLAVTLLVAYQQTMTATAAGVSLCLRVLFGGGRLPTALAGLEPNLVSSLLFFFWVEYASSARLHRFPFSRIFSHLQPMEEDMSQNNACVMEHALQSN